MSTQFDETISTYDSMAKWYADSHWGPACPRIEYQRFSGYCKGGRLLDAGCGPGRDSMELSRMGYDVIGIDASEGMIGEARSRFPKGKFLKMDISATTFGDGSFDGIWCYRTLQHFPKAEVHGALRELRRLLKRGGILYVTVTEGDGEHMFPYPNGMRRFFASYSEDEIKALVEREGFMVLEVHTERNDIGTAWIAVIAKAV